MSESYECSQLIYDLRNLLFPLDTLSIHICFSFRKWLSENESVTNVNNVKVKMRGFLNISTTVELSISCNISKERVELTFYQLTSLSLLTLTPNKSPTFAWNRNSSYTTPEILILILVCKSVWRKKGRGERGLVQSKLIFSCAKLEKTSLKLVSN